MQRWCSRALVGDRACCFELQFQRFEGAACSKTFSKQANKTRALSYKMPFLLANHWMPPNAYCSCERGRLQRKQANHRQLTALMCAVKVSTSPVQLQYRGQWKPEHCTQQEAIIQPFNHARSEQVVCSSSSLMGKQQRRAILAMLGGMALTNITTDISFAAENSSNSTTTVEQSSALLARATTTGNLKHPGNSIFSKPGTIYYPKWLFGEWHVKSTFTGFRVPLGDEFVDTKLLTAAKAPAAEGGLGSSMEYNLRWFSTLPDTLQNNVTVWLGLGVPSDAIIPDRAFNLQQQTNAALGWEAVDKVTYDPRDAPDRETVEFSRLTPDMRPLPPRKAEVYINNSQYETVGPDKFVTSELFRQVMLGVRSIDVNDYEVITSFEQLAPGRVVATQRNAVYLEPRDARYFQANGRAVAIYDYQLELQRMPAPQDAGGAQACVMTPKSVVQCI